MHLHSSASPPRWLRPAFAALFCLTLADSALAANLALNKAATGSAACNTNEGPAKAVNGSVSGGNSDKFCSSASSKWLQVDLGSSQSISGFVVKHAGAGGEATSYNTKAFNIQTSTDGSTWTTQTTVSSNTLSTTTHTITATMARYAKLNITTPTQTTDAAARIYEFEVNDAAPPPPPPSNQLQNGVAVNSLAAAKDAELSYTAVIPAGATNLAITTSGGTGDADLYVKFGAAPTTSSYDCRPYTGGNAETCTFATPSAGTYYIKVRGYTAFSGLSLKATWTAASGGGGNTVLVLDQVPQFGIYRSTEPTTYTPPAGVLMWNKGTEYARKLTADEKTKIGDDLALRITYHAQCDPYDRFASVFFIIMPKDETPTVSTQRVTLTDFISPFSDMWQGTKATRVYPDAPMGAYAAALANPDRDVWVGISGGSNPQYGDDACENHGVTDPAIAEVGFKYSLALVSSQPLTAGGDPDMIGLLSRSEEKDDNITTTTVAHTAQLGIGTLAVSIAGYGASNGGQEYTNTTISVKLNGAALTSFSTKIDCATYEQYSPRGNPGIFRNNTTTNPRSWCPGALVPVRYFDMGDITGKTIQVTLDVGNPSPWTVDSIYRTSVTVLEH